jgi:nicotinate-nucleotide adenylyltransferase
LRVAIYGGSFDPPHLGHYEIVLEALKYLEIDKVIVLPNFLNPWKKSSKYSPKERLNLLKKLFADFEKVEVSSFEIDNGYPTKTFESIRYFSKTYREIFLIIGADNLKSVHKWDNFDEIEKTVTFVIAERDNIEIPENYIKLRVKRDISSTKLREKIDLLEIPEKIKPDLINLSNNLSRTKKSL